MTMVERAVGAVEAARAASVDIDALARATDQDLVDLLALTGELTRVVDAQRVRLAGAIAARSRAGDEICSLLGSRSARDALARAFGIRTRDAAELLSMAAATAPSVSITGEMIATDFPGSPTPSTQARYLCHKRARSSTPWRPPRRAPISISSHGPKGAWSMRRRIPSAGSLPSCW